MLNIDSKDNTIKAEIKSISTKIDIKFIIAKLFETPT